MAHLPDFSDKIEEHLLGWGFLPSGRSERIPGGFETWKFVRTGRELIVCQAAVGARWPEYAERRRIRSRLARTQGRRERSAGGPISQRRGEGGTKGEAGRIVLFTEPSRSLCLVSWRQTSERGFLRYIEVPFPSPWAEQAWWGGSTEPPPDCSAHSTKSIGGRKGRLPPEVRQYLVSRLPGPLRAPAGRDLASWCRDQAEPGYLRDVWESLWRVRVIDPDCADGRWLLGLGSKLEDVGLALLDRIRSSALDPGVGVDAEGRSGKLCELVRSRDELTDPARSGVYLRRRFAAESLFGWARSRRELSACRGDLRGFVEGAERDREPSLNARLCTWDSPNPSGGPALHSSTGAGADRISARDLHEEGLILHLSRNAALAERAEAAGALNLDGRRFWRLWERRRRTLIRKLAGLEGSASEPPPDAEDHVQLQGTGLWAKDDLCYVRGGASRRRLPAR